MIDDQKLDKQKFKKTIRGWRRDPGKFVKECFEAEPISWQTKALNDLGQMNDVAIRAGRHCGKSCLLAWAALWYLTVYPECRVVCTAPAERQLQDILWPEIEKWLASSPLTALFETTGTKVQLKENPKRHFAVARTASKRENLQGFNSKSIFVVIDEASGVDSELVDAVRGSLFSENALFWMASNPTQTTGRFADVWLNDWGNFSKYTVNAMECELTNDEQVEQWLKDYPPGSMERRVYVEGKFPRQDESSFIMRDLVEKGIECTKWTREPVVHLGVDVARTGTNQTVIASRSAQKVIDIEEHPSIDTQVAAKKAMQHARRARSQVAKYSRTPARSVEVYIKVDDTGVGGGVTDRLKEELKDEELIYVIPVNGGEKPYDGDMAEMYMDAATAAWGSIRERLQQDECNLPDNQDLKRELTNRSYKLTRSGKNKLTPKSKMKGHSPDIADAVALAFYEKGMDRYNYIDVAPIEFRKKNEFAI